MALQHTILIVEDSSVKALVLQSMLVAAGYQVIIATNGAKGCEVLKKQHIDLIISDIYMPYMNGFELCRHIKQDPLWCNIPVILSTALSSPTDLIMGIEVSADNYIPYPCDEKQLLNAIEELLQAPPRQPVTTSSETVILKGQEYVINTSRQYILNFLLSAYENIHQQNHELSILKDEIQKAYQKLEKIQKEQAEILHNIFPEAVTEELMAHGAVTARRYEEASVMFLDFVGFTKSSRDISPQILVEALNFYFAEFDSIIEKNKLERIKTIGDGYMCACGVPEPVLHHAIHTTLAALEILDFITDSSVEMQQKYGFNWKIRIGIHSGPVVAGVIGKKRPAYDIWGGTVNIASRMESHSEKNKINISEFTYEKIKDKFKITPRGKLPVKSKEGIEMELNMYFVDGLK